MNKLEERAGELINELCSEVIWNEKKLATGKNVQLREQAKWNIIALVQHRQNEIMESVNLAIHNIRAGIANNHQCEYTFRRIELELDALENKLKGN